MIIPILRRSIIAAVFIFRLVVPVADAAMDEFGNSRIDDEFGNYEYLGVRLNADEGDPLTLDIRMDGHVHVFTCPEPCDAPASVNRFVERHLSGVDNVDEVERQIWWQYAIKEYLLAIRDSRDSSARVHRRSDRTNVWFETNTFHLPGHLLRWIKAPGFLTSHPLRVLEIGSYEGGSATWFQRHLLHHPESRLVCIDPWQGWTRDGVLQRFKANIALYPHAEKVTAIQAEAIEGLALLIANGAPKFDFIYIDGDHTAAALLVDVSLSWHLLRVGGLMLLDDYLWTDRSGSGAGIAQDALQRNGTATALSLAFDGTVGAAENEKCDIHLAGIRATARHAIDVVLASIPGTGFEVLHCGYQLLLHKLSDSGSTASALGSSARRPRVVMGDAP